MTSTACRSVNGHHANGNIATRVEGGLTHTQSFDAENRLISVTVNSQTTQFIYDGNGNLVKKLKPDGTITVYIGGIYEVELNGATVTKTTLYYPAAGAMRVIDGGNNNLYYVLRDHLGSASVTLDASGNAVAEVRYYPFGETRVITGTMPTDRLYTGQRLIDGLGGLYHYNARFYLPKVGRFVSADSVVPNFANPQSLNRYSYVLNSPLRYGGYTTNTATTPAPTFSLGDQGGTADTGIVKAPSAWVVIPGYSDSDKSDAKTTMLAATSFVATTFDFVAFGLNGLYVLAMDGVSAFISPAAIPFFEAGYQVYSILPNSFSTLSMTIWVGQGFATGENSVRISGGSISLSVSQDTLVAATTNIAGWTVLREPHVATVVDGVVLVYDIGRFPNVEDSGAPLFIPAVNPTLTCTWGTGCSVSPMP